VPCLSCLPVCLSCPGCHALAVLSCLGCHALAVELGQGWQV